MRKLLTQYPRGYAFQLPDKLIDSKLWVDLCQQVNMILIRFNLNNINFKLFGMLGLTLIFIIAQGIYLSRHIQETDNNDQKNEEA